MQLPYGVYIGADGSETLFNRQYAPIVARDVDGKNVRRASGWVEHVSQKWFYDDRDPPHCNRKALQRCQLALDAFVKGEPINRYFV